MAPKSSKASRSSDTLAFSTMDFFLNISLPKSGHTTGGTCSLTKVPHVYKCMFHKFEVKPWLDFPEKAAQILAGEHAKTITNRATMNVEVVRDTLAYTPPSGEADLAGRYRSVVLDTANKLLDEVGGPSVRWGFGKTIRTGRDSGYLRPDISLEPKGAGSSSEGRIPVVGGEMKLPCYRLGSAFTAKDLTRRIQNPKYDEDTGLLPLYQALSYAVYSANGVALLSNFDQNRFFKVNIRSKEIWMSDLVEVDQRMDQRRKKPHMLQALLYTMKKEESDRKEFSSSLVKDLIDKGEKRANDEARKKEEEEKKKKSSSNRAGGAGSSKDHAKGGKAKKRSDNLYPVNSFFPAVSRAMQRCKMIGVLGEGVTGEVCENELDGQRVAVKIGSKDYSSELDCEEHVENEISVYELLKDLQGSVIPRMIEGGLDPMYTASMVLITEKVGMAIEETEREITVGGKALDRENLILFKQKGSEGLKKMGAYGVVHDDPGTRNMRVEMKDGKVDRVCWLDFGQVRGVDGEVRSRKWAERENSGEEIEAKSEGEVSEDLEDEEMIGAYGVGWFEDSVDRFISYTDE